MTHDELRNQLADHGQEHVLQFWAKLDNQEQDALLDQAAALDLALVDRLRALISESGGESAALDIEPADVVRLDEQARTHPETLAAGEQALRAGQVGVILVAGGQGTRLGYDGPKGAYRLGPLSNASLFEIHARKILALRNRYGAPVPFYIMTSETNDRPTRRFFEQNNHFGLLPEDVIFFVQGMLPALTPDGQIVLDAPGHIFRSPDGHGGTLTALDHTGNLTDMKQRGLTTLFYFQVDNALVNIADPAFVGAHILKDADMSLKVCAKRDPEEGLGMAVRKDGRLAVVEYTELTREQKHETLPNGELRFLFGSVAIHVFSLDFLVRESDAGLPFHLARKKVPTCAENGDIVEPKEPNVCKFEKFIFDALPDAREALVLEFAREDEFSPLKNADGTDSPATAHRDIMLKAARWLTQCGVNVPRTDDGALRYKLEIDPCYALDAEELQTQLPDDINVDADLLLK